jgi:hypothetical protein
MVRVAVRHGVSANYLARVCDYLNVPYPHRGYWAKRQFGKAPTRLPLPAPRPGEVVEWERGDAVPRPTPTVALPADSGTSVRPASRSERPARHQLLAGIRESFEKARFSEVGYLRPFKRNLVDIFVTKEALAYALDTANDLFLRLEARRAGPAARRRPAPLRASAPSRLADLRRRPLSNWGTRRRSRTSNRWTMGRTWACLQLLDALAGTERNR